mmetsp:Transcript_95405/g.132548  ORF Transcript_95405/g.132548 Transcript_95405/m.132548 type:complete len:443 (+) Transcript_95405:283-1611(+)
MHTQPRPFHLQRPGSTQTRNSRIHCIYYGATNQLPRNLEGWGETSWGSSKGWVHNNWGWGETRVNKGGTNGDNRFNNWHWWWDSNYLRLWVGWDVVGGFLGTSNESPSVHVFLGWHDTSSDLTSDWSEGIKVVLESALLEEGELTSRVLGLDAALQADLIEDVEDEGQRQEEFQDGGGNEFALTAFNVWNAAQIISFMELMDIQAKGDESQDRGNKVQEAKEVGNQSVGEWDQVQQNSQDSNGCSGVSHSCVSVWPSLVFIQVNSTDRGLSIPCWVGFLWSQKISVFVQDDQENSHDDGGEEGEQQNNGQQSDTYVSDISEGQVLWVGLFELLGFHISLTFSPTSSVQSPVTRGSVHSQEDNAGKTTKADTSTHDDEDNVPSRSVTALLVGWVQVVLTSENRSDVVEWALCGIINSVNTPSKTDGSKYCSCEEEDDPEKVQG